VEYLFVGGIAARAYGARRLTYDVDCLPATSRANLDRLAVAMRELHARLRVEGLSDAEAAAQPVHLSGATLARMRISTWRTDAGDLDILAEIPTARAGSSPTRSWRQERRCSISTGSPCGSPRSTT
jgi:hypothetical protein